MVTGHAAAPPRSDGAAPSEFFAALEDRGHELFVRVKRVGGGSVPVTISREALEDHFGAENGPQALAHVYLAYLEPINSKVLELDPAGTIYTDAHPMLLGTNDFV